MEGNTRPQPPAATRHPGPPHRTRGAMSGEQANAAREWFAQFTDVRRGEGGTRARDSTQAHEDWLHQCLRGQEEAQEDK